MQSSSQDPLSDRLRVLLAARGVSPAAELCGALGISQPSFSRLIRRMPDVERIGAGRTTRWGLRRPIDDLPAALPVTRILPDRSTAHVATLILLANDQLVVRAPDGTGEALVEDLPWFLEDARPAGFLGRLVARRLEGLGFPDDPRRWSTRDTLRYLARYGGDLPGDLAVGDEALRLAYDRAGAGAIRPEDRPRRYPELAADLIAHGPVGSSAAGEQPKFLTIRDDAAGPVPVLVKFSPPRTNPVAERVADLLVCEHLALACLADAGIPASTSHIVCGGERLFLEVERFDRAGLGRRGVVSLATLDAEFTGVAADWVATTGALIRVGRLPASAEAPVRALHTFGLLIGNTDMHGGNLSFWLRDDAIGARGLVSDAVAPVYDMLPMAHAPRSGELIDPPPALPPPLPDQALAHALALRFWEAVLSDERISAGFKAVAAGWRARVAERAALYR